MHNTRKINFKNIHIALVEPMYAGNIGAVARAMKNTELEHLIVVDPKTEFLNEEGYKMACGAKDILQNAHVYPSLREALSEMELVIGTTRRIGLIREHAYTPRRMAEKIIDISQASKIAILFGNEVRGLRNSEIALCQWLVTIPTHPIFGSLNVSQAAMIVCYELYQASSDFPPQPDLDRADVGELESMYDQLKATLLKIGFLDVNNPERLMFAFRRMLGRAALEKRDVRILRGLCRQIAWYASHVQESKKIKKLEKS